MGQLEVIARATFSQYLKHNKLILSIQFSDIMYILDKRLNDHGKNWRHVYKTLIVLEYCVCCGSEPTVDFVRGRLHYIKTLREFRGLDDNGIDNGSCVREKSRELCSLMMDEVALLEARRTGSIPTNLQSSSSMSLNSSSSSRTEIHRPQQQRDSRRNSYDDLQSIDEDTAMAIALKQSLDSSQSSLSTTATTTTTTTTTITAAQLLEMDDESFGNTLQHNLNNQQQEQQHFPQKCVGIDSLLRDDGIQIERRPSVLISNPFMEGEDEHYPEMVIMNDPFTSPTRAYNHGGGGVHPIAIPLQKDSDKFIGAKPVGPGVMAPQFSTVSRGQNTATNVATAEENDPFADLL